MNHRVEDAINPVVVGTGKFANIVPFRLSIPFPL